MGGALWCGTKDFISVPYSFMIYDGEKRRRYGTSRRCGVWIVDVSAFYSLGLVHVQDVITDEGQTSVMTSS